MGQAMRELTAMEPAAAIARLQERSRFDDRQLHLMNYSRSSRGDRTVQRPYCRW